jgi:Uncharacterized protein conserved in bacteria (DUF2147)
MVRMTSASRMIVRLAIAAGLMTSVGPSIAVSPTDPSGIWLTDDGSARIRVEHCGAKPEQICGYVVWMKQPAGANGQLLRDPQKPDPAKRSRTILGQGLHADCPLRHAKLDPNHGCVAGEVGGHDG